MPAAVEAVVSSGGESSSRRPMSRAVEVSCSSGNCSSGRAMTQVVALVERQ